MYPISWMKISLHAQKKLWSYIKSKRQDFFGVPSLKANNQITVDNKEKANVLNDYFHSVFTTDDDSPPSIPSCNAASVDKPHISIKGVADLINQLKSNKATGPDDISVQLLELAPIYRFCNYTKVHFPAVLGFRNCSYRLETRPCHSYPQERFEVVNR